jgi:hypothetical protein
VRLEAFEPLPIGLRAFATSLKRAELDPEAHTWTPSPIHPLPHRSIVFDCETTTDSTQRLRFGSYRLFLDRQSAAPGSVCVQEGLLYADDLPERAPADYRFLCSYVKRHRADVSPGRPRQLRLLSRSEFVEQVIWRWGHQQQATIVGFNLPFDLTRLALDVTAARKVRGISLRLWEYDGGENRFRPRIVLRRIDRHRTLMSFAGVVGTQEEENKKRKKKYFGRFLDLATLTFAHSDQPGLSLEAACERFGVRFSKRSVQHGTALDDKYVDYCRADVQATAALFRNAEIEHRRHPIRLPSRRVFSGATIAKSYWDALGIAPTAERLPGFPPELSAVGMAAFFGGRSDCRIRRTEMPVVYCDFKSMYPTCASLMGTWELITAEHLVTHDATKRVQRMLEADDFASECFQRDSWRELHTLVKVNPNGAILPVRARYLPGSDAWNVGVNPLQSSEPLWYPLGDVLAAALLGPVKPIVIEAVQFVPEGRAPGLRRVKLRGELPFSPGRRDFFATLVEERETHRAGPLGPFLKILANAASFGILAEFQRETTPTPVPIVVHTDRTSFTTTTHAPENPGPYCFPPLAATVTGAARLMLALLEHEVAHAGGSFVFCDTDSMAIVARRRGGMVACGGGSERDASGAAAIRVLSWRQVDRIIERFTALNPFDATRVPGSILKIEAENYGRNGRRHQLSCYAISPKRYQLTNPHGVEKSSAHGLGHLLAPAGDEADWIEDAWAYLRRPDGPRPRWFDLPAVSKITVASPEMLTWFAAVNEGKFYADRIKPANFLLVAYPDPLAPIQAQPVAPYDRDPTRWLDAPWIDRNTGQAIRVTTRPLDGTQRDAIRVRTYGDMLARYLTRPDPKVLTFDGRPVGPRTEGLLIRRPVEAVQPPIYLGKEANNIEDRAVGLLTNPTEHTNVYEAPGDVAWTAQVVPILQAIPTQVIAARSGVNLRTVQRACSGSAIPHPETRSRILEALVGIARDALGDCRRSDPPATVLHRFREKLQFA